MVLIDLDLGGSNLHTCLGIRNNKPGIGSLIYKQEPNLKALLYKTDIEKLYFIPGDTLLPGTANLDYFTKQKIIREIKNLKADYIIIDLGSGSSYNIIDFFLMSPYGIIVTTPETTAILNAYSFLKTALYRFIYRTFPSQSREREVISDFVSQKIEGTDLDFKRLFELISEVNPSSLDKMKKQLKLFYPRILVNKCKNQYDLNLGLKLRQISQRNLGLQLEYVGFLLEDQYVTTSILKRKPIYQLNPDSDYCRSLNDITEKLLSYTSFTSPHLYDTNEDIEKLKNKID